MAKKTKARTPRKAGASARMRKTTARSRAESKKVRLCLTCNKPTTDRYICRTCLRKMHEPVKDYESWEARPRVACAARVSGLDERQFVAE